LLPNDQRQFDGDPSALARRTLDGALPAKQSHPLPDSFQTETLFADPARIEAHSPILDLNTKAASLLNQCDPHSFALAVLAGVGQALLYNAIDGILLDRHEAAEFDGGLKFDLRARASTPSTIETLSKV